MRVIPFFHKKNVSFGSEILLKEMVDHSEIFGYNGNTVWLLHMRMRIRLRRYFYVALIIDIGKLPFASIYSREGEFNFTPPDTIASLL